MRVVSLTEFSNLRKLGTVTDVGFIPTMGYLHDGHLSLVRWSKKSRKCTAVSIFVNPKQFAPGEDFDAYPRDNERDLRLLESEAVDYVILPTVEEMYPPTFSTRVHADLADSTFEAKCRPTFFEGVATVVCKLLSATLPATAYFGQKDHVQCCVVANMVKDLCLPIEIVIGPTSREHDGLAMSSRNTYLDPIARKAATIVSKSLFSIRDEYNRGERDYNRLIEICHTMLSSEDKITEIQYVSLAHRFSAREFSSVVPLPYVDVVASVAVKLGGVRLIDNVVFDIDVAY